MKKNIVSVLLLMIIILSVFSNVVFADKATIGKVTATTVRLRKEASSSSDTLKLLGLNNKVDVYDQEGDWYQVGYNGIIGYVSKEYIEIVEEGEFVPNSNSAVAPNGNSSDENQNSVDTSTPEDNTNPIDTNSSEDQTPEDANIPVPISDESAKPIEEKPEELPTEFVLEKETKLRNMPNFNSKVVTNIANGTKVKVITKLGNWIKVSNENTTGWIVNPNVQKGAVNDVTTTQDSNTTADTNDGSSTDNSGDVSSDNSTTNSDDNSNDNSIVDNGNNSSDNTSNNNANTDKRSGTVNTSGSRLRESKDGKIYTQLDKNTKVEIVGEDDTWYIVNYGKYKNAYIAKSLVD